ncbi:unnamed protein product [Ceutorhynchus assimilis]|uniref:BtpA family membrane complex biogenesis protein n=1 Tax=Ceutorhynchus assimilis TaxID=467358 RepID=A0A9N9MQE5_9CUCU|nr:unnamed protein product [Ceutorhynchus assimilis]
MLNFRKLFTKKCSIIGMVHVKPLPGTPLFGGNIEQIVTEALRETEIYLKNDLDALLIENMHDVPYIQSQKFGPEITATMTRICTEIQKITQKSVPCGIQVLSCGNKEALAIAKACALDFIRAEGFVFSHIGDEGFTDANAGELLRYRKYIDANDVLIFADIKKKHSSHAITSDVSLSETAKAAEYFLADGLVLTGTSTGVPAHLHELNQLKETTNLPIFIGSGVTKENLEDYIKADALIVGSHFKKGGLWSNEVDENRVREFMDKIRYLGLKTMVN